MPPKVAGGLQAMSAESAVSRLSQPAKATPPCGGVRRDRADRPYRSSNLFMPPKVAGGPQAMSAESAVRRLSQPAKATPFAGGLQAMSAESAVRRLSAK